MLQQLQKEIREENSEKAKVPSPAPEEEEEEEELLVPTGKTTQRLEPAELPAPPARGVKRRIDVVKCGGFDG